jgi:hypothetical protein
LANTVGAIFQDKCVVAGHFWKPYFGRHKAMSWIFWCCLVEWKTGLLTKKRGDDQNFCENWHRKDVMKEILVTILTGKGVSAIIWEKEEAIL